MGSPCGIAIFCEDEAHELFATSLIERLAAETHVSVDAVSQSARGGHGRAITELKEHQDRLRRMSSLEPVADVLVVMIDANCHGWDAMRKESRAAVDPELFADPVIACPDPHVERWCMADPDGFAAVVGIRPQADPRKCERDLYKSLMSDAVARAGKPILTDVKELIPDIVARIDLHRAGRQQPSLGAFVHDLRSALIRSAAQT
jgi:hypothetical protein